jgi:hypothetical protein
MVLTEGRNKNMKKTYSKPLIAIENFTLSTDMAANCENIFGLQAQDLCGIPDDNGLGFTIFNTELSNQCMFPGQDDSRFNGLCYHIPAERNNLFNS